MRDLILSRGLVALVDDDDYEWLSQWKWCAGGSPEHPYAIRGQGKKGFSRRYVLMHREILGMHVQDRRRGDHVNGNGLDNRRANLRIATAQQNAFNSPKRANNSAGYKGVCRVGERAWKAEIRIDGKKIYLGRHPSPEAAAAAYESASLHYHGEFANKVMA